MKIRFMQLHRMLAIAGLVWAATASADVPTVDSLSDGRAGLVYFKSVARSTTPAQIAGGNFQLSDTISGDLILPEKGSAPFPAMVIAHGSGGIIKREYAWAEFFKARGIASFIVDTYKPRGILDTVGDQSQLSYPASTADHLLALKLLASHPKIDARRIGIIGFSRGGQVAVGTAFETWRKRLAGDLKFAIHLPFYGGCSWIADRWDGAPIHTFMGDSDDYAQPVATCEAQGRFLDKASVTHSLSVFKGARHGFDNLEQPRDVYAPRAQTFSKCSYIWNVENQVFYAPAQSDLARPASELRAEYEKCLSHGSTIGPNTKATEDAKAKIGEILSKEFQP